jgi:hypothetical protein
MVFGFGYPRACRFRKTKQTNQIWLNGILKIHKR